MRVINKGLATKVFAGVLSIIPMTQTGAQKAASLTTRNVRSSHLLASANVNLSAVARDTYDASEKFVTKSKKGVISSKVGHRTKKSSSAKVAPKEPVLLYFIRFKGFKDIVNTPTVPPKGVVVLSETSDSKFYKLNNKMISEIFPEESQAFLDTVNVSKTIVQVPKSNAKTEGLFPDLLNNCHFQLVGKEISGLNNQGIPFVARRDRFFTCGQNGKAVDCELVNFNLSDGSKIYSLDFRTHENSTNNPYNRGIRVQIKESTNGEFLPAEYGKYVIFDGESEVRRTQINPDEFTQELSTYIEPIGDLKINPNLNKQPKANVAPRQEVRAVKKKTLPVQQATHSDTESYLQAWRIGQQAQDAIMEQDMRSRDAMTKMWKDCLDRLPDMSSNFGLSQ